jgi:hypothetical protein
MLNSKLERALIVRVDTLQQVRERLRSIKLFKPLDLLHGFVALAMLFYQNNAQQVTGLPEIGLKLECFLEALLGFLSIAFLQIREQANTIKQFSTFSGQFQSLQPVYLVGFGRYLLVCQVTTFL